MRRPLVGGLDPRLLAAANALKGANGPKPIPTQTQLSDRRRLRIDYGRPGEGKKKWARRRTVEVRRRGYDITKRVQPEPFSISRVVLDLDAEDSPYVRPYGFKRNARGKQYPHNDRKEQMDVWNHDPKLDALVKRMDEFKHEIRSSEEKWHAPLELYDPRRISKRDIMEVVLLGTRTGPGDKSLEANRGKAGVEPKEPTNLLHVLRANGIPDRILGDDTKTLDFMAAWRKVHPVPVSDLNDFTLSPVQAHAPWPGLHNFKRALTAHLGSKEGTPDVGNETFDNFWMMLGGNRSMSPWSIQVIVDGLRTEDPIEALAFLHNAALCLSAPWLDNACHLPETLSNLAVELAIQTDNVSMIPTFLYDSQPTIKFTLETWLKKTEISETTAKQRLDFLGLLDKENAGSWEVERDYDRSFSLRGIIDSDVSYQLYVKALGSIGAIRTLWHEWHGEESSSFPIGHRYHYEPNNPEEDASPMFIDALLRYRALRRYQLRGLITPVTGDFDHDLELDRRDIASFGSTPAYYGQEKPGAEIDEGGQFRQKCIRALNIQKIEVAMDELGKLLLSDNPKA